MAHTTILHNSTIMHHPTTAVHTASEIVCQHHDMHVCTHSQAQAQPSGHGAGGVPEAVKDDRANVRLGANVHGASRGKDEQFNEGFVAPHPGMKLSATLPEDKESFMEHPGACSATTMQQVTRSSCK